MTSLGLEQTDKAAREVAPWVKWLARMGMLCSAILWILVGVLAVGVALGAGGTTTDRTGALHEIGKQIKKIRGDLVDERRDALERAVFEDEQF